MTMLQVYSPTAHSAYCVEYVKVRTLFFCVGGSERAQNSLIYYGYFYSASSSPLLSD